MEPIPIPLVKRLVLTFLVGIGCFFAGLVFYLYNHDRIFLGLSCCILSGSLIKTITLYIRLRRKEYILLEGICTQVQFKLFSKSHQVLLVDAGGTEHTLLISKDYKIRTGLLYRFYFKTASGISPGKNPLLEKMLLTEQLLGVEQIATTPSQQHTICCM